MHARVYTSRVPLSAASYPTALPAREAARGCDKCLCSYRASTCLQRRNKRSVRREGSRRWLRTAVSAPKRESASRAEPLRLERRRFPEPPPIPSGRPTSHGAGQLRSEGGGLAGGWALAGVTLLFERKLIFVLILLCLMIGLVVCISGNLFGTPHVFVPPSATLSGAGDDVSYAAVL